MPKDECLQLKNINYQTMLLNRKSHINSDKSETTNIEQYLSREHQHIGGGKKAWNKLEKMIKIQKLNDYVDVLTKENKIPTEVSINMKKFLRQCLERKRLQRIKDVIYNSIEGKITKIPGFNFNKTTHKFSLRRVDKKNLISKSLAPKTKKNKKIKKLKTIKNKPNRNKSNKKRSPSNSKTSKANNKTSKTSKTNKKNKKRDKKSVN